MGEFGSHEQGIGIALNNTEYMLCTHICTDKEKETWSMGSAKHTWLARRA